MKELRETISAKLAEAEVPVVAIDGRIKRLWSINQKLKRQKIELEQVYDFIALRIVTDSVKDCYAALGIIHQTWSPVPGRIKDFIAMPRPNGYQSLHTSVISEHGMPFEVQIRTIEMHRMAEEGIAAHWKYKEGRVGDQRDERYFQWMRQLLEYQQDVRDPQEFIQNLKIELYPEEVYAFTPKGQVKAFPRGATPSTSPTPSTPTSGNSASARASTGKMVPLRHASEERRHRRDRHADGPQAEPRLAELSSRRRSARYKIKHLIHSRNGTRARRPRPEGVREGSAPLRSEPRRRLSTEDALAQSVWRSSACRRPTMSSRPSGTARSQPKQVLGKLVPRGAPGEAAGRRRSRPPSGACWARATRRSRSAASTT